MRVIHLFHINTTIFLLPPLYTLSYLLTLLIFRRPVRLRSPRSRPSAPATASLSFDRPALHTSSLPSQALNSLSHHYQGQEQEPPALTACASTPSPAAFDHTKTTTTHRRSLSIILTRPAIPFLSEEQRQSRLSCATATGQPRDE